MTKRKDLTDTIALYNELLEGKRERMPKYTWSPMHGGHDNFKKVLRYVVLDKLQWDKDTLIANITLEWFEEHRLRKGLEYTFKDFYSCVSYCFPEWDVQVWELPVSRYESDSAVKWLRWLIDEKLGWKTRSEILMKFSGNVLKDHDSYNIYNATQRGEGIFDLLSKAYPEHHFERSEFKWGRKAE